MIHQLTPVIYTDDIEATVEFYVETLGFECVAKEPVWGWARIRQDQADFMISQPNEHIPFTQSAFTGSFYLRTDNVDALWMSIRHKARVCYPIEDFEYGMREFAVYDNNGYLLQFGQDISGQAD